MPTVRRSGRVVGVTAELTNRENEVLDLAVHGLSNDEIAARLAISRRTVEAHMRTLFRKMGVTRRAQLVALYEGDDPSYSATERVGQASLDVVDGSVAPLGPRSHGMADRERQLRTYA